MSKWAIRIQQSERQQLSKLRGYADIEVCSSTKDGTVWIQGTESDKLQPILASISGDRFDILPDDQLIERGKRVPTEVLPSGDWKPVDAWLEVELPVPQLANAQFKSVSLELKRVTSEPIEANGLLTTAEAWLNYIEHTAEVRIKPLQFAACADGRVVVIGSPLPPLPGTRLIIKEDVAIPAGFEWSPQVEPIVVRRVFNSRGATDGDLVIWTATDQWEAIDSHSIVPATRAAVRTTLASLGAT
ncbi:MAG: hypothetical protein AB8G99_17915 [Planctomycetaceae bacterium]